MIEWSRSPLKRGVRLLAQLLQSQTKTGGFLMRGLKLFCLLTLVSVALEISVVDAQNFRARAMASYNDRGMIGVSRMSALGKVSGCVRLVMVGTVVSVESDDRREIVNFSFETRNGRSRKVYLSKSLYKELPSEAEQGLARLLARGKRIRVKAYRCGGSDGMLEADEIRTL
jgi:hypothetical protein